MHKTTVYLPDELRLVLRREAGVRGRSEADLIRQALTKEFGLGEPRRPRGGLITSGDPTLSETAEAALEGFGSR